MSKPLYCTHCGTLLNEKVKRIEPRFDRSTGQEVFEFYHYWKCPNKRWVFDSHDDFNDVPVDWVY